MSTSKVISTRESHSCQRWRAPDFGNLAVDAIGSFGDPKKVSSGLITAEQLEAIQQQAYDEGYSRGHKQGLDHGHKQGMQSGEKEVQEQVQQLHQIMQAFAKPLEELDQQMVDDLAALAMAVAKQLVRREIKTEPGEIVAVVREAMAILPTEANDVRLELHPDDAVLVREVFEFSDNQRSWKISEDPTLSCGGCRVLTTNSRIDATLEKRINTVIASVMGGEREQDERL